MSDPARLEAEETAVLEEAPEHRAHANALAEAFDPGAQRGDRAGDDVDVGACLRRAVELLHHGCVGEVVELDPDARLLARRDASATRWMCSSCLRSVNGATS